MRFVRLLGLVPLLLPAQGLAEPAATACAHAFEDTQRLNQGGKLLEARQQAIVCAQTSCPEVLRADCISWLAELEAALPTVVIDVQGARSPVQVLIDDAPVAEATSGRSVTLNPGKHEFAARTARGRTVSAEVLVLQGKKNQIVALAFEPTDVGASAEQLPRRTDDGHARLRPLPLSLASVAAAALVTSAVFAVKGLTARAALDDCAPCEESRKDHVRRDFLIADLSAALAIIAGGAAYFTWH